MRERERERERERIITHFLHGKNKQNEKKNSKFIKKSMRRRRVKIKGRAMNKGRVMIRQIKKKKREEKSWRKHNSQVRIKRRRRVKNERERVKNRQMTWHNGRLENQHSFRWRQTTKGMQQLAIPIR